MRELLEYLARALVDDPDAVAVEQFEEDDGTSSSSSPWPRTTTARSSAGAAAPPTRCGPSSRPRRCKEKRRVLVDIVD